MEADRKVYDSDIAVTPVLRAIADEYARSYVGNFDMMIEARRILAETGALPQGVVRSVLNTLRTDPLRQDLWGAVRSLLRQPQPSTVAEVIQIEEAREARIEYRERHRRQRPPRRRRLDTGVIRTPVTLRHHFAVARWKSHSPVIHWISGAWCDWRNVWLDTDDVELWRRPVLQVATFCNPGGHKTYLTFDHRPTPREAWPGSKKLDFELSDCRSCLRVVGETYAPEEEEA
jgi:hypothetical protein